MHLFGLQIKQCPLPEFRFADKQAIPTAPTAIGEIKTIR